MKASLLLITGALFLCSLTTSAQQFSPTTGVPCQNCHPTNYDDVGTPWISDVSSPGGAQGKSWNIPGFQALPVPPSGYSQGLPVGGGKNSFVSLKTSEGATNDKVYLIVSGFDTSKDYKIRYNVLSGSVYDAGTGNTSPFGESATLTITTNDQLPILVKELTTDITSGNRNKWIANELSFKPSATTLKFTLSGKTTGNVAGYINFDIDKYPFDCIIPNQQIEIETPLVTTPFPGDKINLLNVTIKTATPATAELVWKSGPNSTDPTLTQQEAQNAPVTNPGLGNEQPYYAFYYAKDFNCYNVPLSSAEQRFTYKPEQVKLKDGSDYIVLSCPDVTADLTTLPDNPILTPVWFTTEDHQGAPVQNLQAVPPGHYYAFYFDLYRGGFSLPNGTASTAHVHVENAVAAGTPDLGPTLDINSLVFGPSVARDFVVTIHNLSPDDSNCSVFFKVSKLPGFNITYETAEGVSQVDGGINTNNNFWDFAEDATSITVTAKNGMPSNGKSVIGFRVTRNGNTPAGTTQSLNVVIPQGGGGGELNTNNNSVITTLTAN